MEQQSIAKKDSKALEDDELLDLLDRALSITESPKNLGEMLQTINDRMSKAPADKWGPWINLARRVTRKMDTLAKTYGNVTMPAVVRYNIGQTKETLIRDATRENVSDAGIQKLSENLKISLGDQNVMYLVDAIGSYISEYRKNGRKSDYIFLVNEGKHLKINNDKPFYVLRDTYKGIVARTGAKGEYQKRFKSFFQKELPSSQALRQISVRRTEGTKTVFEMQSFITVHSIKVTVHDLPRDATTQKFLPKPDDMLNVDLNTEEAPEVTEEIIDSYLEQKKNNKTRVFKNGAKALRKYMNIVQIQRFESKDVAGFKIYLETEYKKQTVRAYVSTARGILAFAKGEKLRDLTNEDYFELHIDAGLYSYVESQMHSGYSEYPEKFTSRILSIHDFLNFMENKKLNTGSDLGEAYVRAGHYIERRWQAGKTNLNGYMYISYQDFIDNADFFSHENKSITERYNKLIHLRKILVIMKHDNVQFLDGCDINNITVIKTTFEFSSQDIEKIGHEPMGWNTPGMILLPTKEFISKKVMQKELSKEVSKQLMKPKRRRKK